MPQAFVVGATVLIVLTAAPLAFVFGQGAEPYADWGEYFRSVALAAPIAVLPASASVLLIFAMGCGGFLWGRCVSKSNVAGRIAARIAMLNPVALAIPLAAVAGSAVAASLGRPAFGIVDAGKPRG